MQVIVERGMNKVEKKSEHWKASTSKIFCGNAAGELLPPKVIYKAKFVYDGWVRDGHKSSVFDCTDSLMSVHSRNGLRKFSPPAWKIMVNNLSNLKVHFSEEVINIGAEFNAPVPTIGLVSFWANEKMLEEPFEWVA